MLGPPLAIAVGAEVEAEADGCRGRGALTLSTAAEVMFACSFSAAWAVGMLLC